MTTDPHPTARALREMAAARDAGLPRVRARIASAATKPVEATEMSPFPFFSHDTLSLHLDEPPSANRWWRNVGGRMVTSKAAREYKQHVANAAIVKRYRPIPKATPVRVHLVWTRGRKSGDLDKRLGVLLDALQGVAYENDSQIVEIHAAREDAPYAHSVVVHIAVAHRAPRPGAGG